MIPADRPLVDVSSCTKCRALLQTSQFHRDRTRVDGRQAWCMACRAEWRDARKAAKRAYDAARRTHGRKT